MIKILSNEPSTIYYSDVKVGESFIYPKYKNDIYIKIKEVYCKEGKIGAKEEHNYDCINIRDGRLDSFCHDDKVCLVNCTVKWEYDNGENLE